MKNKYRIYRGKKHFLREINFKKFNFNGCVQSMLKKKNLALLANKNETDV